MAWHRYYYIFPKDHFLSPHFVRILVRSGGNVPHLHADAAFRGTFNCDSAGRYNMDEMIAYTKNNDEAVGLFGIPLDQTGRLLFVKV